jgi:Secretion system C-terminal sorting domain/FG-GAP repeat
MKAKFYILFLFPIFSISAFAQRITDLPKEASRSWYAGAASYVQQMEYSFHNNGSNEFSVANSANSLGFRITGQGYRAFALPLKTGAPGWTADFVLQTLGRTSPSYSFSNPRRFEKNKTTLHQDFGFAEVEYLNNENGLRQNFIVKQKPAGEGQLRLDIGLLSSLRPSIANGSKLVYHDNAQKPVLSYEDLKVWDANNEPLVAHMELTKDNRVLSLVVDDQDAEYPVTIDPLSRNPEWTTSANGILPALLTNLSLQVHTLYGYTVVGLGDVNNDGFSDVAVSAPTMSNVVTGTGSLLGVGAVFIYYGASGGLDTVPGNVLQPSTAVTGAAFGFSVAAGDVTGDNINDIIIGAPLDGITLDFGGSGGILNGTVGKVYVYQGGAPLAPPNPTPLLNISLNTALLTNATITLNALFGFSVAVADDMNGDTKKEIIVGSPTYARISGSTAIKTGGAFVFLSDPSNSFSTIRSLDPPTGSLLGLGTAVQSLVEALPGGGLLWLVAGPLLNPVLNGQIEGLLFGYCVEGAGKYNNDAFNDVAVGAPAGVSLGSLTSSLSLVSVITNLLSGQVLGGTTFVFPGNGTTTGVNTAPVAKLQAQSTGLLSNAANLFGYKIRAVRDASGSRDGNLLISAPTGGALSNVVGGLRLKAGQIFVFKKRTGVVSNPVTSDQVLSSPRSTSLLALLAGQNLNVSALYGADMDNIGDINCDGNADIIAGEPLSSNVPLIGANIAGGAAYIYLGRPDGTYKPVPVWDVTTSVSSLLGVNATSLVGWSVAGAGRTQGPMQDTRIIVGGPSNTLDFGVGLLNLGNTIGTLTSFTFDNNGLGKSYIFNANLCGLSALPTTLLTFTGMPVGRTVQLDWTSAVEQDVELYQLEHSTNGTDFSTIAVVFSKGQQKNEYEYPDEHPAFGNNYYRLRIVDKDGAYVYSKTVTVRFNDKTIASMAVAPNPVRDEVRLKLTGLARGSYSAKLYNATGQLLLIKRININFDEQTEILQRLQGMPNGIYWLNINDNNDKKIGTVRLLFSQR